MNKWLYLMSSCIFLFLLVISYPIVKDNFSSWNLYIFISFILCFFASIYLFYKKVTYIVPKQKNIESSFTPIN